jgi:hypothetical protein
MSDYETGYINDINDSYITASELNQLYERMMKLLDFAIIDGAMKTVSPKRVPEPVRQPALRRAITFGAIPTT